MASFVIIGFLTILVNVLLRRAGSWVSPLYLRCRTTPSLEMYPRSRLDYFKSWHSSCDCELLYTKLTIGQCCLTRSNRLNLITQHLEPITQITILFETVRPKPKRACACCCNMSANIGPATASTSTAIPAIASLLFG
jgi:hypothetical protein